MKINENKPDSSSSDVCSQFSNKYISPNSSTIPEPENKNKVFYSFIYTEDSKQQMYTPSGIYPEWKWKLVGTSFRKVKQFEGFINNNAYVTII